MGQPQAIYLIVSGAVTTYAVPELLAQLPQFELPIYTLPTDNAQRLISAWSLAEVPGHRLIESYFDPVLASERAPGLTLVAPATFNTVNKIAQGLADTLAHSLVAEAIGAGWPVIVAPSVNRALANHPRIRHSLETLHEWGVTVLEMQPAGEMLLMAEVSTLVKAIATVLRAMN
jgi:phosphopantothenoylcysteine synthetase/decarboxylase